MSIVKVQGNDSNTGIFTVESPDSATDRTLTLPDETGTLVISDGSTNITAPKFSSTTNTIETAIFRINDQTVSSNTTIASDENASCTGPLTVASGVYLTVASGGNLKIV